MTTLTATGIHSSLNWQSHNSMPRFLVIQLLRSDLSEIINRIFCQVFHFQRQTSCPIQIGIQSLTSLNCSSTPHRHTRVFTNFEWLYSKNETASAIGQLHKTDHCFWFFIHLNTKSEHSAPHQTKHSHNRSSPFPLHTNSNPSKKKIPWVHYNFPLFILLDYLTEFPIFPRKNKILLVLCFPSTPRLTALSQNPK